MIYMTIGYYWVQHGNLNNAMTLPCGSDSFEERAIGHLLEAMMMFIPANLNAGFILYKYSRFGPKLTIGTMIIGFLMRITSN